MKKCLKYACLFTVVLTLTCAIAPVLGNCLLYKTAPSSDAIIFIVGMALSIFLSFILGYDTGYDDGKNNKR